MKKLMIIAVWCLPLAMLLTSCSKEEPIEVIEDLPKPMADFTVEQQNEDDPFTFSFTNKSSFFEEIRWEFGDDSSSINVSPVHTFLGTGEYRVTMRALNSQGYWAQKETLIHILPDSIMRIEATPQSDGTVRLTLDSKMDTEDISWYKGLGTNAELIDNTENIHITVGSTEFQDYSVRTKTPKGSRAETSALMSTYGIVTDVTRQGIYEVLRDNNGGPTHKEGSPMLIDNNINTKFLAPFEGGIWMQLGYDPKVTVGAYTITSANDSPSRDPVDWKLLGRDDLDEEWTVLDAREGEVFETRFLTRTFFIDNPTAFRYYRLDITKNVTSGSLQMAEWKLLVLPEHK